MQTESFSGEKNTMSKVLSILMSSEMWCWRRMKKIKLSEKVTNEQVLDRIEEDKMARESN